MLLVLIFSTNQGWWKWSHHSHLGNTEKFAIYGQRRIVQNFGRRNICEVKVALNWSDQSQTPSPAPAIKTFKGSQHQGILASVRCNNLVTILMFDITGGWGCFWCMDACVGGWRCALPLYFPCGACDGAAGLAFFVSWGTIRQFS